MNTNYFNVSSQSLRGSCSRFLLLLGLVGSLWAGPPPPLPVNVVRFKGTLVAMENHQDYWDATSLREPAGRQPTLFFVTAAGRAETSEFGYPLLGSLTVIYVGMVDYTSGAGQLCTRFIDANGDSLFTTSSTQVRATKDPRVTSVVELHTVTGGTGYFAGMGGSLTVKRMVKLAADGLTASSSGSFDGLIGWTSMAAERKDGAAP